jgi:hypothetical protein
MIGPSLRWSDGGQRRGLRPAAAPVQASSFSAWSSTSEKLRMIV